MKLHFAKANTIHPFPLGANLTSIREQGERAISVEFTREELVELLVDKEFCDSRLQHLIASMKFENQKV